MTRHEVLFEGRLDFLGEENFPVRWDRRRLGVSMLSFSVDSGGVVATATLDGGPVTFARVAGPEPP